MTKSNIGQRWEAAAGRHAGNTHAAEGCCDTPPAYLPARPLNQADLAAVTERVRRRVIR
jgi:hypothetical protein